MTSPPDRRARLSFPSAALVQLMQLPAGTEILDVRMRPEWRGVIEFYVRGSGWLVYDGQLIPPVPLPRVDSSGRIHWPPPFGGLHGPQSSPPQQSSSDPGYIGRLGPAGDARASLLGHGPAGPVAPAAAPRTGEPTLGAAR